MVRYTTRDDKIAENEALIQAVFDELRSLAPAGIRYEAFRLADGAGFVHIATIDTEDGSNPLPALDSFKRFSEGIEERCAVAPAASALIAVDRYGS
jgi:hypothetical protein